MVPWKWRCNYICCIQIIFHWSTSWLILNILRIRHALPTVSTNFESEQPSIQFTLHMQRSKSLHWQKACTWYSALTLIPPLARRIYTFFLYIRWCNSTRPLLCDCKILTWTTGGLSTSDKISGTFSDNCFPGKFGFSRSSSVNPKIKLNIIIIISVKKLIKRWALIQANVFQCQFIRFFLVCNPTFHICARLESLSTSTM